MTVENISRAISMKVWDQAGIDLTTPGSAIGVETDSNALDFVKQRLIG